MALPNPLRKRTESTKTAWGYTFDLTPSHPGEERMHSLKYSCDSLADDCVAILLDLHAKQIHPESHSSRRSSIGRAPLPNLLSLLIDHHDSHPTLSRLWEQTHDIPEWVSWDQISRGQEVFQRYGGACLVGLAFRSLLGGFGAGRVVETLARTGGFNARAARRRLYETTQHVLQVTSSLDSIKPGGAGWASTLRVRLLHAQVRRRILSLADSHPGYFDVSEFGIPINDLDSIGTVTTFCAVLLFQALPRQGVFPRSREKTDYVALWRYVAYLLGCPSEPFASSESAKQWMEALQLREMTPSPASGVLARNVLAGLAKEPPLHAAPGMLAAAARWLNGNALCDALGVDRPFIWWYVLMAAQCAFFSGIAVIYRLGGPLGVLSDETRRRRVSRILWGMIVEHESGLGGKKTSFGFEWVPEVGKGTSDGAREVLDEKRGMSQHAGSWMIGKRNLRILVFGLWLMGLAVWGLFRLVVELGMLILRLVLSE